jgi:hypothetical protein
MSVQQQSGSMGGQGVMAPVVVLPVLALILNGAIIAASSYGYTLFFPVNIIGGFSYNVAPLFPAATAIVIALGLWRYGGLSQGAAWGALVAVFIVPIVASFIINYLTGILLANLSDAAVTNSQNFYFILFLKSAVSAASVLLVMAFFSPLFRGWAVWLAVIILWAGGDTLLFGLFRNQMITRTAYQWLFPVVRVLGYIVIGYRLQARARSTA